MYVYSRVIVIAMNLFWPPTQENDIEKEISCGQLEELIEQANDELYLIPKFAEWRLWEGPNDDIHQ